MGFPEAALAASPAPTPSLAPNSVDGSNNAPLYKIKSQRVITHSGRRTFFSGPLRSPSRIQNVTAQEIFMDELAVAAGADPIAFRLKHLPDERMIDVINVAAKLAKWQPSVPGSKIGSGRVKVGRGVSASLYEGDNGYNALIVEVSVDTKTGKVTVDKAWSGQDCGPIMNPRGMRMQAEGCLMQTISRSLLEEVKWGPNGITSKDWESYPVIRFNMMPKVFEFEAINRPDEEVMGAGEVLTTNGPAAISNAIFDAPGARLYEVPFTPARVREALKAAGKLTA